MNSYNKNKIVLFLYCEYDKYKGKNCSVGVLPDHLNLIEGGCETDATVPCSNCTFECDEGFTISHNETVQCIQGVFDPPIPECICK